MFLLITPVSCFGRQQHVVDDHNTTHRLFSSLDPKMSRGRLNQILSFFVGCIAKLAQLRRCQRHKGPITA